MIAAARARIPSNVHCLQADVMDHALRPEYYDAIVSMSALHHLPLEPALARLSAALRPGGVLVAVALPQRDLRRELPVELAATAWHHLLGVVLTSTDHRPRADLRHGPDHDAMPIREPQLTTAQERA